MQKMSNKHLYPGFFKMITLVLLAIFVFAGPASASYVSELFFSEYIEGSSYNKAVEIFNGTSGSISMSQYSILIYYNGSTSAGATITLSGTLASGDVYVVANSSASTTIRNQADLTSSNLSFNGDDAVVLKKGSVVVDVIGRIGYDPGTEWGTGYTSTADNTLVRKSSNQVGDTNGGDDFNPSLQWNGYATDTFSYLGSHVTDWFSASTPTPTASPSPSPTPTSTFSPTPTPTSSTVATPTATVSGTFNHYYGQLHAHTAYSDGQQTPADAFYYARYTGGAHFMAVTDHSNWFDSEFDWTKSTEWANTKTAANAANVDGQFVALAAFEMTWSSSSIGHMNTFNTEWFETRNNTNMTLPNYYNRIAGDTGSISQWNHPGTTFGDFSSFGYYSAATDNVLTLIEVANGSGPVGGSGYYPSYDYLWKALDKGWHVSPTIGQDNHSADWITANEARTVILATSLTRANILEGMRQRRVYAVEDRNLRITYTINGSVMGSILTQPATLSVSVNVSDVDTGDNITKLEMITEGGVVAASQTFASNNVNWNPTLDPLKKYYYVRVTQADGNKGFSAPIWTGR